MVITIFRKRDMDEGGGREQGLGERERKPQSGCKINTFKETKTWPLFPGTSSVELFIDEVTVGTQPDP